MSWNRLFFLGLILWNKIAHKMFCVFSYFSFEVLITSERHPRIWDKIIDIYSWCSLRWKTGNEEKKEEKKMLNRKRITELWPHDILNAILCHKFSALSLSHSLSLCIYRSAITVSRDRLSSISFQFPFLAKYHIFCGAFLIFDYTFSSLWQ